MWPDTRRVWPAGRAVTKGGAAERHPHLIPSESGAGAAAALRSKGPTPMMYDLTLPVIVVAAGAIVLAAVYVMSKDPGRRARAWQLLKLLLCR